MGECNVQSNFNTPMQIKENMLGVENVFLFRFVASN